MVRQWYGDCEGKWKDEDDDEDDEMGGWYYNSNVVLVLVLVFLLFAQELTHSGLPSSTFVQGYPSIFGAPSWIPSTLSPQYMHKFLLR